MLRRQVRRRLLGVSLLVCALLLLRDHGPPHRRHHQVWRAHAPLLLACQDLRAARPALLHAPDLERFPPRLSRDGALCVHRLPRAPDPPPHRGGLRMEREVARVRREERVRGLVLWVEDGHPHRITRHVCGLTRPLDPDVCILWQGGLRRAAHHHHAHDHPLYRPHRDRLLQARAARHDPHVGRRHALRVLPRLLGARVQPGQELQPARRGLDGIGVRSHNGPPRGGHLYCRHRQLGDGQQGAAAQARDRHLHQFGLEREPRGRDA
mmetsp:Transcript_21630/g.58165  ORF Transcript_21630/g.58165 Transcript_21630/m.58165 type:complete len:266 (-) Transcript_21630:807-1604(-)